MAEDTGPGLGAVGPLCRLVVDLRLAAVILTLCWVLVGVADPALTVLLAAGAFGSVALLRYWDSAAPLLERHPALLGLDCALSVGVLVAVGSDSPFFVYTLGTAALAGALLNAWGAAFLTAVLLAGYYAALPGEVAPGPQFQLAVGLPALYPLSAAGGRALRRLLTAQAASATRARAATAAAVAAEERARFAREMHDSLAKTLHGIAMSANGLARWVEREPRTAVRRAEELAEAAQVASREARTLMGDLRAESGDADLATVVRGIVADWAADTGIATSVDVAAVSLDATARYELLCVLREALRNVALHAGARTVAVTLTSDGATAELVISDDGRGIDLPDGEPDPVAYARRRERYGLVGMAERARRAGGGLRVEPRPGGGTVVHLTVRVGELEPARGPL